MSELSLIEHAGDLLREFEATAWLSTWRPAVAWLAGCNTLATRRSYASALRKFMASAACPLAEVGAEQVLAWKAGLVSRRLSPRTVRHHLSVVAAFLAWCIEAGHHPGPNPAARVPLPRVGRAPVGLALDGAEVERLVAAGRTARDRAILAVLASGGLRASELCGLQERDVHLVKHHGDLVGVRIHVRQGKGGRPRSVELDSGAAAALVQYLVLPPGHWSGRVSGPTWPFFQWLDGSGKGIGYHTVYHVVRESAAAAGLGHVAPHDLRRTQITMALDAGEPLPAVQRRAGHASMGQTVGYYRG